MPTDESRIGPWLSAELKDAIARIKDTCRPKDLPARRRVRIALGPDAHVTSDDDPGPGVVIVDPRFLLDGLPAGDTLRHWGDDHPHISRAILIDGGLVRYWLAVCLQPSLEL